MGALKPIFSINERGTKEVTGPELSSIQSSQEQIEKYKDKMQTETLKTTVGKKMK